jgi:hypothetical protein
MREQRAPLSTRSTRPPRLLDEFHAPLGIEPNREVLSATPWREALRDPEQLKTAGVEAGQKVVVGGTMVAVAVGAGAKFVAKKM